MCVPTAGRNGRLSLVRGAVVPVLESEPVPVDRRLHRRLVGDVDEDVGPLPYAERRSGDGSVVGEHPRGRCHRAGELPANPDNALQVRVSRLRSVIGPSLVTEPPGYRLAIDGDAVDATRFERLVAERRFADALALWRGRPLTGFADQPWARAEARRLEELHATAIEEHVDARLATGDHASLVAELEALVSSSPLRERLRGQLMLALYRCGRAADAFAVFRSSRIPSECNRDNPRPGRDP